ncbi:MAG: peptidoglycan binding domain-containing protein [Lachnospirales bacterium]
MRSKNKELKHSSTKETIDKKMINDKIKNTEEKLKNNLGNLKETAKKASSTLENKSKSINLNKDYILWGIGTAFFLVTAIWSISFAISSKTDTAINRAYEALDNNLIFNGVFIEEVNIGCLTKEQAIKRATNDYAKPRLQKTFTISSGSYSKDVTYEDLGGSYDVAKTVNEAYKLGRGGSKTKQLDAAQNLEDRKEYLVSSISIDDSKLKSTLNEIAKEVEGNVIDGKVNVDALMSSIKNDMLIGQSDIVYDIPIQY